MNGSRAVVDLVNTAAYHPGMVRIAVCEACGWELNTAPGVPVPSRPGLEVFRFTEPPHRLLVWRCNCGAELGVWTDRDGVPVAP